MVYGEQAIQAKINKIRTNAIGPTKENSLELVGQKGVALWKLNTPVITGRLRASEGYTTAGKVVSSAFNMEDSIRSISDKDSVIIGTNVIYGPKVEFLANNGSRGFTQRAYSQLKLWAERIFVKEYKDVVK